MVSLHKVQCALCRHHRDAGHGQRLVHHCPAAPAAQHRGCTPQASQDRTLPHQLTWQVNASALREREGSRLLCIPTVKSAILPPIILKSDCSRGESGHPQSTVQCVYAASTACDNTFSLCSENSQGPGGASGPSLSPGSGRSSGRVEDSESTAVMLMAFAIRFAFKVPHSSPSASV